jgi:hypothetical protein
MRNPLKQLNFLFYLPADAALWLLQAMNDKYYKQIFHDGYTNLCHFRGLLDKRSQTLLRGVFLGASDQKDTINKMRK